MAGNILQTAETLSAKTGFDAAVDALHERLIPKGLTANAPFTGERFTNPLGPNQSGGREIK